MHESLQGKVVLVTGAAGGIGRAIAERFANEGSVVVVNDIDAEAAGAVVESIVASGGRASTAIADVSNGEQVATTRVPLSWLKATRLKLRAKCTGTRLTKSAGTVTPSSASRKGMPYTLPMATSVSFSVR